MAQKASDVISDDDVRAVVDKIRNLKYQNRMAFRDYDATNNDSNSVSFPVSVSRSVQSLMRQSPPIRPQSGRPSARTGVPSG